MTNSHNYDLKLAFANSSDCIETNSDFLSRQSEVFKKLISEANPKNVIQISDADPTLVYESLQCIHTLGRSLENVSRAMLLRVFAKNYKIYKLYILGGKFIHDNLTAENIGEVHDLACHYNDLHIQYYCWIKFDFSWREIFSNPAFYKCSSETMMRCVSRPIYKDMDEYLLWNAVYTWSLKRIKQDSNTTDKQMAFRKVLENFLPYIRFLVMRKEELEVIFKSNILTSEECVAIKAVYHTYDVTKLPLTLCQEMTPRKQMFVSKYTCHIDSLYCPKHSLLRWVKAGDTFYAEFKLERDCFLKGLLLPLRGFAEPLTGMIELTKLYNSKQCNSIAGAFKFELSSHVVELSSPIFVESSSVIYINVVILDSNPFCQIEPYANCNIGNIDKIACEEAENWKSFYINDIILYF